MTPLAARLKVGASSGVLRRSGDRDQHEKQLAMLKAEPRRPPPGRPGSGDARGRGRATVARIRGTYDDIVHERDELKARVEALQSEARGWPRPGASSRGTGKRATRAPRGAERSQEAALALAGGDAAGEGSALRSAGGGATVTRACSGWWARAPSCASRWWGRCWKA